MKKVLILIVLVLAVVLIWVGYRYGYKKPVTKGTYTTPVVGTVPSGTPAEDNLQTELKQTEDDGGAADFVELEKSTEGL